MIRDLRVQISVLAATKSQIKYTVLLLLLLVVVHSKAATLRCTARTALHWPLLQLRPVRPVVVSLLGVSYRQCSWEVFSQNKLKWN